MSCCGGCCSCQTGEAQSFGSRLLAGLASWPVVLVGGLSLVASFILIGKGCGHDTMRVCWYDPAFISVMLCGLPLFHGALKSLFVERRIRSALLISCAMVACLAIGQIFAAGEVAFIMALGEKLEDWTLSRAKRGLHTLVSLVPKTARKVVTCPNCRAKGILFEDIPVQDVKVGDGLVIRNGETIPVDGVVVEGETTVDQSSMTGESVPIPKQAGDEVYSGTLNRLGEIRSAQRRLAQIVLSSGS